MTGDRIRAAVGYTRLSQDSDTSIERQKRHIQKYADEHGFDLQEILDDGEHSSGFDDGREEYQRLRETITTGDIDAVIVNEKLRLVRDFDDTMRFVLDLRKHNVEVHTHQDGRLELEDPVKASIELVKSASDHESKQKEIQRAKDAVEERLTRGYDHGRPPIGLQFDDDKHYWVPDHDDRFQDVVDAIHMIENGASYREVQDEIGIAPSTLSGIMDRKQRYLEHVEEPVSD